MAVTPEGRVKAAIDALLARYKIYSASRAGAFPTNAEGWYYKPVQGSAFGVSGIPDYIFFYKGLGGAIEAKAPGKKPTGFQALQLSAIKASGGAVFVIDGEESLKVFEEWLDEQQEAADFQEFLDEEGLSR